MKKNRKVAKSAHDKDIIKEATHSFFRQFQAEEYIQCHEKRKIVSLSDSGSKTTYRLVNDLKKDLVVYHVDGGVIKGSDDPKCDYAIYSYDDILILIELKGADYNHALEQLEATYKSLVKTKGISLKKIYGRVVLTKARVPDTLSSKETIIKKLFMKLGGNLEKKTSVLEDVYSKF